MASSPCGGQRREGLLDLLQAIYQCFDYSYQQGAKRRMVGCPSTILTCLKDFFYICPGHLVDRGFCQPEADEAKRVADQKKQEELDREIEAVKKEYEEKQKLKREKRKGKDKEKDKEKEKEAKGKEAEEDKQDEKAKDDKACDVHLHFITVLTPYADQGALQNQGSSPG